MFIKSLNRRQARWSEFLSLFNFFITYGRGKAGAEPDALTRRFGDLPKERYERLLHPCQTILTPQNLSIKANSMLDDKDEPDYGKDDTFEPEELKTPFEELWEAAYNADPIPNEFLSTLHLGVQTYKQLSIAECSEENSKLIYQKRLNVPVYNPLKLRIMSEAQSNPATGHPS
jgi:hypothetical protein